jgi:methylenetetrahydrofolate--tRNA-(uracil-5-)-methyltransferase
MVGALTHFIAEAPSERFQPMPPNFGLLPDLPERIRDKRRRYGAYRDRSLADLAPYHGPWQPPEAAPADPSEPLAALSSV